MSKTGNLSINSENIFPIIKKWLYSDHDIFVRELVSNGCDAITKLKKLEAMQDDIRTDVDFVLTYEELMGIFEAKEINFSTLPDSPDLDEGTRAGRGFAVAGGVAAAVEELIHKEHPDIELKTQRADGLRDCRKLLMLAKAGKLDGYLLEGMACPGGCVAGAGTVVSADTAAKKLAQHMAQASGETAKDSKYRDLADQLN